MFSPLLRLTFLGYSYMLLSLHAFDMAAAIRAKTRAPAAGAPCGGFGNYSSSDTGVSSGVDVGCDLGGVGEGVESVESVGVIADGEGASHGVRLESWSALGSSSSFDLNAPIDDSDREPWLRLSLVLLLLLSWTLWALMTPLPGKLAFRAFVALAFVSLALLVAALAAFAVSCLV
eukprot:4044443-Pleurochrysis_carterae.AAC.1